MKAPKCRVCGVIEWRHVCGGVSEGDRSVLLREMRASIGTKTRATKTATKTPNATKTKKGGRPRKDKTLTSTERSRLRRERLKGPQGPS